MLCVFFWDFVSPVWLEYMYRGQLRIPRFYGTVGDDHVSAIVL